MTRTQWSLLIALMLVAGVAWIWAARVPAGASSLPALPPAPAVGRLAPGFKLQTVAGESFDLAALRGTPVVLNFWATWCPPCRTELPELDAAGKRYAGQVAIVGVDQAEQADVVQKFVADNGLGFSIPLDDAAAVSQLYAVRALPTTFFIDREGIVRHVQVGPLTEATLAQRLRTIYP
jgi:cytochrome c biogenesis protein CcmG, thiol:disulfide interchange protein DsbE